MAGRRSGSVRSAAPRRAGARSGRGSRAGVERTHRLGLIGRDLADASGSLSARRMLPFLVAVLVVALGVTAVRIELVRVRYALGAATLEEQRLLDEERSLTARRRQLRDPVHLAREATKRGFVRPEHLVDVPGHATSDESTVLAAADRPEPRRATLP